MPHFRRDGIALHCRRHGAGPALLPIRPDLHGSGRSDKPRGPYAIATFAADLRVLLDALAIGAATCWVSRWAERRRWRWR